MVQDAQGNVFRLAKKGRRYHSDASTRLHDAKRIRPPPAVAASRRLREVIADVLATGTHTPESRGAPGRTDIADIPEGSWQTWKDDEPESYARRPYLHVFDDDNIVVAVRPIYDDAPVIAWKRLSKAAMRKVRADVKRAPQGVHLRRVNVQEKTTRVMPGAPGFELAATVPGARPVRYKSINLASGLPMAWLEFLRDHRYEVINAVVESGIFPNARRGFGTAVEVPDPQYGYDVPVVAWRTRLAEQADQ